MHHPNKGFTLIELLIVIGILAVLSTAAVLMLNPADMLAQTRDNTRMTDLNSINQALGLYQYYAPSPSFGTANTVYISLPDTDNIAPDDCDEYALPTLSGWFYHCALLNDYRKIDGSGWVPVNLTEVSGGSPLATLPIDPINNVSQGLYYSYIGGSWTINSILESQKYLSANAKTDGGADDARYETGPKPSLWIDASGLVGYWKMDESSWINDCATSTVADSSQGAVPNNGKSCPNLSGPNITSGKTGNAGNFDGTNDYINVGNAANLSPVSITIEAWAKANSMPQWEGIVSNMTAWGTGFSLQMGTTQNIAAMVSGAYLKTSWTPSVGVWYHIAATHDAATNLNILYVNGKEENRVTRPISYEASPKTYIGVFYTSPSLFFNGSIDEVRIYNRALSPAEIRAAYNATN
jgi:prepilin-type N-terminal cleavage/methylation domain-containing protein